MSNLNRLGEGLPAYGITIIAGGVGGYYVAEALEGNLFPDFTGHHQQLADAADQAQKTSDNTWYEYSAMPPGDAASQVRARYSQEVSAQRTLEGQAEGAQYAQIGYELGGGAGGAILLLSLLALGKHIARRHKASNA